VAWHGKGPTADTSKLRENLNILRWRLSRWLHGIKTWHVTYIPNDEYLGTRSARSAEEVYEQIRSEAGPMHDRMYYMISLHR
jgi:hypothetical protein